MFIFQIKEEKENRTIVLKHGEPMIFGKEKDKGLILDGLKLRVVNLNSGGFSKEDLLIYCIILPLFTI